MDAVRYTLAIAGWLSMCSFLCHDRHRTHIRSTARHRVNGTFAMRAISRGAAYVWCSICARRWVTNQHNWDTPARPLGHLLVMGVYCYSRCAVLCSRSSGCHGARFQLKKDRAQCIWSLKWSMFAGQHCCLTPNKGSGLHDATFFTNKYIVVYIAFY